MCRPRAVSEEPAPDWSTRVRSSWVLVSMSPTRFFLFFFVFFFYKRKNAAGNRFGGSARRRGRRRRGRRRRIKSSPKSSRLSIAPRLRSSHGGVETPRRRLGSHFSLSGHFRFTGEPKRKKKIKKNEKHNGATLFLRKPLEVNSIFRRYETSHSWTAKNRKLDDFLWSFFFVLVYLFLSYGVCRVWMEVSSIGFNKKKVQPKKKIAEKMTKSLISPSTHWLLAAFFLFSTIPFFLFLHEGCRRLFVCVCVFFCV